MKSFPKLGNSTVPLISYWNSPMLLSKEFKPNKVRTQIKTLFFLVVQDISFLTLEDEVAFLCFHQKRQED